MAVRRAQQPANSARRASLLPEIDSAISYTFRIANRQETLMPKYWIVVAAAEHVRRGLAGGFVQACHGKAGPLKRMTPGDGIACYSPSESFRGADRLQAFTALGFLSERALYIADMGQGFRPARRDILWSSAQPAPIAPLLEALEFASGRRNWGYQLRFGVLEISMRDFRLIAAAMGASAEVARAA
jgi:hypothetical protein